MDISSAYFMGCRGSFLPGLSTYSLQEANPWPAGGGPLTGWGFKICNYNWETMSPTTPHEIRASMDFLSALRSHANACAEKKMICMLGKTKKRN
jgi:hypothetical protein